MYTITLTKGVPDFSEGAVSFDEDGHLERGKTPTVMNPNDEFALRAALQTKVRHGGTAAVMSMGPPGYGEILQEAMRSVYADELYLLSDREMAAADTWATAITLATGIEKVAEQREQPDLVFAGFKTADGETGHTGPQACWCLDWPILTHVIALDVVEGTSTGNQNSRSSDDVDEEERTVRAKRLVEGDIEEIETVEAPLPAVIVTDPEFEPVYRRAEHRLTHKDLREETTERAKSHEDHLTTWDHADLNLDPDYIGLDGSPTIVSGVDPIPKPPSEREATMVEPDDESRMGEVLDELLPYAEGGRAAAGGD
ncbi:electron transfer flavoprotein subunit beta/FixA family protein [Halalkalicoccus ordinarius]|uniref:electron transfer flavoprotein subunit beta/FixA family protein n=1 Tax=Halalkalicoccus ordinarius TaxID=3116651 RepID=UPI00300E959C